MLDRYAAMLSRIYIIYLKADEEYKISPASFTTYLLEAKNKQINNPSGRVTPSSSSKGYISLHQQHIQTHLP